MALLEIKNINCFYGDVQVIYDVSMHIDEGEVISLIGANGAGKSTMLRTISGLMKPRSGEVIFENQPVQNLRPEKIVERGIVQVPEGRKLFSLMTVRENLDVGAHNSRAYPHLTDTIKDVYKLLPRLEEREKQQAITLSGGEQQMVAIARGLMSRPEILMMDEPSLGLAPLIIEQVFQVVQELKREGITVFMAEQNAYEALCISDYAYVIETGHISLEGEGKALLEDPRVQEAYLGIKQKTVTA